MVCPKCKKEFEITEAISHKMREDVLAKANIDHKEELAKIKAETEKRLKEESLKGLQRANEEKEKLEEKLLKGEKERKEFEKKVRDEALKKAEDEQRFKLKEKDLHIEELRKVNEDFKRKLEQGSQQRQGEAMELELEESLKLKFPND